MDLQLMAKKSRLTQSRDVQGNGWNGDLADVSCGLLRSYSMGIDLGTTYSCVGIFKDGEAKCNAFSTGTGRLCALWYFTVRL